MARLYELSKQLEFTDNAQLSIFEDIIVKPQRLRTESGILIGGTLYIHPKTFNHKGVLILPGTFVSREQFDLLSKRLAYQGYGVLTIDLPSQAESQGEWKFGLMSEFVFAGVRNLRERGLTGVSVIGHSVGAVACMFAALNYNTTIENDIYKKYAEFMELIGQLASYDPSDSNRYLDIHTTGERIAQKYKDIKEVILNSVRSGRLRSGRFGIINSFILLGPPPKFQEVIPPAVARFIGGRNQKFAKRVTDTFINKPLKWNVLRKINPLSPLNRSSPVEYKGPDKNSPGEFLFLRVPELKEFMEYVATVKNPCDYVELLKYFRTKSEFIRAFLDRLVLPIPKLPIYGKWDSYLKGFTPKLLLTQGLTISKKRQEEISSILGLIGTRNPIVVPRSGHYLNKDDYININLRSQMIQDSRVVRVMLHFLHETL